MPVFNTSAASGTAASFAALLAAVLLAVLGNLALHSQSSPVAGGSLTAQHRYTKSLTLGFVLLVLLLATSYMFVLLSGLQILPLASSEQALGAGDEMILQTTLIRTSALLFIVSGSALAVGAAASMLILGLVLSESHGADLVAGSGVSTALNSAHSFLVGGVWVVAVFLLFGYDDIAQAFEGDLSRRWTWTIPAALLLALPSLAHRVTVFRRVSRNEWRANPRRLVLLALTWLVLLPVTAFLVLSNVVVPGSPDYGSTAMPRAFTMACALWGLA